MLRVYPMKAEIDFARHVLTLCGVPEHEMQQLHVLVAAAAARSDDPSVVSHVCSRSLPPGSIHKLAAGVYMSGPELCFLQMGEVFNDTRELVEFGYELCGSYEMGFDTDDDYRERAALCGLESIESVLDAFPGARGVGAARRAMRYVREGSRSPMETAHIMTLVLPRRMGGSGIRGVTMNYRVDVPPQLRHLARQGFAVLDGCIPGHLLDLEYNGFHHDEDARRARDEERRNVLEAMGYRVKVLTRFAFFDGRGYRRHLRSIFRILGIREDRLPAGFWGKQEELRRFVLRRWLV